jgi:hypothetical protein
VHPCCGSRWKKPGADRHPGSNHLCHPSMIRPRDLTELNQRSGTGITRLNLRGNHERDSAFSSTTSHEAAQDPPINLTFFFCFRTLWKSAALKSTERCKLNGQRMTLEQSFLPIPATSRSSFAPILNGTIQTKWSTANALKRIAILHSRTHFYLHLLSKVPKCS